MGALGRLRLVPWLQHRRQLPGDECAHGALCRRVLLFRSRHHLLLDAGDLIVLLASGCWIDGCGAHPTGTGRVVYDLLHCGRRDGDHFAYSVQGTGSKEVVSAKRDCSIMNDFKISLVCRYPSDGGWEYHVASSISEWIVATIFCFYILTFTDEFRDIHMEHPAVSSSLFVTFSASTMLVKRVTKNSCYCGKMQVCLPQSTFNHLNRHQVTICICNKTFDS